MFEYKKVNPKEYLKYQKDITKIFFEEDPIHLRSPREDEYDGEAKLLVINLPYLIDKDYVSILDTIYVIFVHRFNWGEDEDENLIYHNIIGDKSNFESSARRIYKLLNGDAQ